MKIVMAAFILIGSIAVAQELRGSETDDTISASRHLEEGQGRFLPMKKEDPLKPLNEGFDIDKKERPRNKRNPEEVDDTAKNRSKDASAKVRGKNSLEKTELNGAYTENSNTKSATKSGKKNKNGSKIKNESKGNDSLEDVDHDDSNTILGRIDKNRVASECLLVTEKFLSSGDLTFQGSIDIPEAEAALCYSLNSLYTELCTPGFLKCLEVKITPLDDEAPLDGKEPGKSRKLQLSTYRYTATTRCGRTCQRNRRISGGQTARHLSPKQTNNRRIVTTDFSSDYTDLCICSKGSGGARALMNEESELPTSNEIIAAFNDRLDSLDLDFDLVSFAEDEPDVSCDRSDTVEERISVDAALINCSDQELEENFCPALIASFNKLSANVCDPLFSAMEECELVSFDPSEEPGGDSNQKLRKLARRGRYAYNAKTRRRNTRIQGQTIRGRGLVDQEKQIKSTRSTEMFPFQDRVLSDSPIDQCTCITDSDDPRFVPVSLAAWTAQLQLELNLLCTAAEVQEIEIEGYPVPCEGQKTDVNVCPIQFLVSLVDDIGFSDAEGLADFFVEVYLRLTEGKCGDFLDRSINPISIIAEDEGGGVWRVILEFGCVGSCEILPGQPNIFDAQGTVLIPCEESECLDPPRGPTQDEFQNGWNTINTGDWSDIPNISSLTPVAEVGSCEVAMCSNAAVDNEICQEFGFDATIPFTEIVPCDFPCFDEEYGPDPLCCFRVPSSEPSMMPSLKASVGPSSIPSVMSTETPSSDPSAMPSSIPSSLPSVVPSETPSMDPSAIPSSGPSTNPSLVPSSMPSIEPTLGPSNTTTLGPTKKPKTMNGSGSGRRKY